MYVHASDVSIADQSTNSRHIRKSRVEQSLLVELTAGLVEACRDLDRTYSRFKLPNSLYTAIGVYHRIYTRPTEMSVGEIQSHE